MIFFTSFLLTNIIFCCDSFEFDVLRISEVPFPLSPWEWGVQGIASINASYSKSINEYTICYRFFVESYNDGELNTIRAYTGEDLGKDYVIDRFGAYGSGLESEGLQGGWLGISRNVTGGGLGGKNMPWYHIYTLPKDIDISKWYQLCYSYSNSLNQLHLYLDGLKAFSYKYEDDSQPLPHNAFENIRMGHNMRGSLTDLQIYNKYLDEDSLIGRTRACEVEAGEIFTWDKTKINILQVFLIFNIIFIIPSKTIPRNIEFFWKRLFAGLIRQIVTYLPD